MCVLFRFISLLSCNLARIALIKLGGSILEPVTAFSAMTIARITLFFSALFQATLVSTNFSEGTNHDDGSRDEAFWTSFILFSFGFPPRP